MAKSRRARRLQFATLPWRRTAAGHVEVLLITSRETRRWVIPKGWGKRNEPPVAAAAREALEEAGVEGCVAEGEIGVYAYEKQIAIGFVRSVRVCVYALEVVREHADWPEKDVREKLWAPPAVAADLVDELDLKALLAAFAP